MSLEKKSVIVTGAASGIGLAIAERFAGEGARLVLADVLEEAGEKAAADLTSAGHEAIFVNCDVSERLDVRNLLALTLEAYGDVDVLINNAAIMDSAPFLDLTEEEFNQVLGVNLKGCFLLGQAAARRMIEQIEEGKPPGVIVNISSINQVFALPNYVAYSASKGGVNQLTKAMALALAGHGIRVNAIGPGSIATPMLQSVLRNAEGKKRLLQRTPLGRIGEPSEIAAIAVFLASSEASYVTGQTIFADGGRLALNLTVDTDGQD